MVVLYVLPYFPTNTPQIKNIPYFANTILEKILSEKTRLNMKHFLTSIRTKS